MESPGAAGDVSRLVGRAHVPAWAEDGLRAMKRTLRRGEATFTLRLGGVWRQNDGRLSVWSQTGMHNPKASCAMAFVYPVGLGFVIWAVVGMRYGEILLWQWIVGGVLLAISIVSFVYAKSFDFRPGPDFVLLLPEGRASVPHRCYAGMVGSRANRFDIRR